MENQKTQCCCIDEHNRSIIDEIKRLRNLSQSTIDEKEQFDKNLKKNITDISNVELPGKLSCFLKNGDPKFNPFVIFDKERFQKRCELWNPFAEKHGFLPLGSVIKYDNRIWMVVDVFPKYYLKDWLERPIPKNCYIFAYLNNGQYQEVLIDHNFDIDNFLVNTKMINMYSSDIKDIENIEVLNFDYHAYIQNIKNNLQKISQRLISKSVFVYAYDSGAIGSEPDNAYHLFKIKNIRHCLGENNYLLDKDGDLMLYNRFKNNGPTKNPWKVVPKSNSWLQSYISFDNDGNILYDFRCCRGKKQGFIVDWKKSPLTYNAFEKILKSYDKTFYGEEETKNALFAYCKPFESKIKLIK